MDYSLCCHILLHSLCLTLPLSTAFTLVCFFFLSFFFSLLYSALKPSCQINPQITNLSTKCVSNVKKIHFSKLLKKCGRSCLRLFVFALNWTFSVQHLKLLWTKFLSCFVVQHSHFFFSLHTRPFNSCCAENQVKSRYAEAKFHRVQFKRLHAQQKQLSSVEASQTYIYKKTKPSC